MKWHMRGLIGYGVLLCVVCLFGYEVYMLGYSVSAVTPMYMVLPLCWSQGQTAGFARR